MSREKEPLPTLGETCADIAAGSMVLARRVPVLTGRAWRLLITFSEGAPEGGAASKRARKSSRKSRKKAAAKGDEQAKSDGTPDEAEQPRSDGADEAAKAPSGDGTEREPKAKERSGWDLLEQLGLGAFTVVIGYVFLRPYLAALGRGLAPAALPIFGTTVVLWIVAAYRAAPPNDQGRQAEGEGGGEDEEQEEDRPAPEAVREAERWLWTQVISHVQQAVADGRKGVHLSALLQEPEFPEGWDVTRLRAHCARLGIPTKLMQIRGSGITGPTHGVHVDQLTAKLGMPLAQALQRLPEQPAPHPQGYSFQELLEAGLNTVSGAPAEPERGAPHEAAPTPSPRVRRPGLRARLHHPHPGAHSPPTRTPSNAPARPSPEPHPQPLPEDGRSPGETPSTTPI
ncbi:hypothetical protein [Streptomyces sp. NPDC102487]|uniref:hypothetical protein n=1 Tax=Streptomyces sp. NPDC102487 TaxID=3366182 RepID=UPI003830BCA5